MAGIFFWDIAHLDASQSFLISLGWNYVIESWPEEYKKMR